MPTYHIDNRLTTGLNNGTSPANAWRSLFAAEIAAGVAAGDVIEVAAGSGPYYEATNTNANLRVHATDISFDAATREIRTAGAVSFSTYNVANKIVRVQGSGLNDGQYQVASATATAITLVPGTVLQNEAAGPRVRVIDITASNGSGDRPFVHDPGRNGGVGNPITWNFNDTMISAGWVLTDARHQWRRSVANPNEWYVLKATGDRPALNRPESAVVNGQFQCRSAGDFDRNLGTVGALAFDQQVGWGDNDALGFSTVYVRAPGNPQTLGWTVIVGQIHTCFYQVWGYHRFVRCRYAFGNGNADGSTNGASVQGRGLDLQWRNCVFMFADGHGFEPVANGPFVLESCVSYWSGHRFINVGNAPCTTTAVGCIDWGSHLFALFGAAATVSTVLNVYSCIGANQEAGAIDKKGASGVLNESHNLWHPRMTAPGGALGYVTPANWPRTSVFDVPSNVLTTEADQDNLTDPQFRRVSDADYNLCDWRLAFDSPAIGRGLIDGPLGTAATDINGAPVTKRFNIGVDQTRYTRPLILGVRPTL